MKKKSKNSKRPVKGNLRARTKNPALKPNLNLRTRYEEIIDVLSYVDKLSEKDQKWLNSFISEYVNADFNHHGKKLHKTKAQRKSCYDRNNSRNRDILTSAKASGNAVVFSAITERDETTDTMDELVDAIDKKRNYGSWDDEN